MALSRLGQGTGATRYEVWEGIGGTSIADLTGNVNFPEPADGATLQAITTQMNWVAGLDARVREVYFSRIPMRASPMSETSWPAPTAFTLVLVSPRPVPSPAMWMTVGFITGC